MNNPIFVRVIKESEGYSAVADARGYFIGSQGETLEELQFNILEAINLAVEDQGLIYTLNEIEFSFDKAGFVH